MAGAALHSRRPLWLVALLSLYLLGALGMAALVLDPSIVIAPSEAPESVGLFRVLFACAALLCALILVGSLRRWSGVARGALLVHVLVAAVALILLAHGLKSDEPLAAEKVGELLAKFGVHATVAWVWSRPAVRNAVSRADHPAPTPSGAASPTGARSGSADHTTR